jgi:hypothetical protein
VQGSLPRVYRSSSSSVDAQIGPGSGVVATVRGAVLIGKPYNQPALRVT